MRQGSHAWLGHARACESVRLRVKFLETMLHPNGPKHVPDATSLKVDTSAGPALVKQSKAAMPCSPVPLADEEAKWLTWQEYLGLCQELRHECAALDSTGRRRSEAAVAWSLQKYLIFAILSCVPDRQVGPAEGLRPALCAYAQARSA